MERARVSSSRSRQKEKRSAQRAVSPFPRRYELPSAPRLPSPSFARFLISDTSRIARFIKIAMKKKSPRDRTQVRVRTCARALSRNCRSRTDRLVHGCISSVSPRLKSVEVITRDTRKRRARRRARAGARELAFGHKSFSTNYGDKDVVNHRNNWPRTAGHAYSAATSRFVRVYDHFNACPRAFTSH